MSHEGLINHVWSEVWEDMAQSNSQVKSRSNEEKPHLEDEKRCWEVTLKQSVNVSTFLDFPKTKNSKFLPYTFRNTNTEYKTTTVLQI